MAVAKLVRHEPVVVVLMGVAGAGKTTVGRALAAELKWPFLDADDFHTPENKERMRAGTPLTDAQREPWLATLRGYVADTLTNGRSAVLACSALRRRYREALLPPGAASDAVRFVHLRTGTDVLASRLARRTRHFMPASLLPSQLATLEEPAEDEPALIVDGSRPVLALVLDIVRSLDQTAQA